MILPKAPRKPVLRLEQINVAVPIEHDDRLLRRPRPSVLESKTPQLAFVVRGANAQHLDPVNLRDRVPDLRLFGVRMHLEAVRAAALIRAGAGLVRGLLGHERADDRMVDIHGSLSRPLGRRRRHS